MSKKMTDPEKWRDPWFRKLSPTEKLMFLFLIDQCNHGGFYEIDTEYVEFCTGIDSEEILGAVQGLNSRCFLSDGWVWIKNYLRHQKNEILNPENNAHKHIIERVKEQIPRFSGIQEFDEFIGANKGLFSPPGKGRGKGKGTEDKYSPEFELFWAAYPKKKSKGDAFKAWKTERCHELNGEILKSVEEHKLTHDWTKDGGKFIPYPGTWIRARGWEDEIETTPTQYKKDLGAG